MILANVEMGHHHWDLGNQDLNNLDGIMKMYFMKILKVFILSPPGAEWYTEEVTVIYRTGSSEMV